MIDGATREPIAGAAVTLVGTSSGAATDAQGRYAVSSLSAGTLEVRCHSVGYIDQIIKLALQESAVLNFSLAASGTEAQEITVTADGRQRIDETPQSVSRLSQSQMEQTRGQTIGETMAALPGITLLQTGVSISKPVVRGLHSQRVLVYNAGVRQEGQQWGAEHAPELDAFSVSTLEVYKGASGVEFGADAIGGIIRAEPRALPVTPLVSGKFDVNLFSNNRQGAFSGSVEGGAAQYPGLGWRASSSYRRAGDTESPGYAVTNSGFSELDLTAAAGYKREWGEVSALYSSYSTTLGIFRGSHIGNITDFLDRFTAGEPLTQLPFSYAIGLPRQSVQHDLLSVRSRFAIASAGQLSVKANWQLNQRKEYDLHIGSRTATEATPPAFSLNLATYSGDAKFQHHPVGNLLGAVGISVSQQTNTNFGRESLIPNFTANSLGIYAMEEWRSGSLLLSGGARYEVYSQSASSYLNRTVDNGTRSFQTVTGTVGALYSPSTHWSIGVNAGTAARAPSINELYSYGVHHGTAQFEIGDASLGIERSFSLDLTLRHQSRIVSVEVSPFINSVQNYIFLFPDAVPVLTLRGVFPTFRYTQTAARLLGIDGSVSVQALPWLRAAATLSMVRGDDVDRREPLIFMPSDRLRLSARIDLTALGFLTSSSPEPPDKTGAFVEIGATLVRKQDRLPRSIDSISVPQNLVPFQVSAAELLDYNRVLQSSPAGYALADLTAGTRFKLGQTPVRVTLSVQNLLNARYRDYLNRLWYYADNAGINAVLRVQIPIGQQDAP